MSVDGRIPIGSDAGLLRRAAGRTEIAFRMLSRPPRVRLPWPSRGWIAIATASTVVAMLLLMFFVDVPAIVAARELPSLIIAVFREITDFGKSGWFLFPLAAVMLVIAFLPGDLPRSVQLTLAAVTIRAGFLFIAIGLPSLLASLIKNMIGRARPFVGGSPDAFLYRPFFWHPAYASMPSGHSTTAFAAAVAIGALWPSARTAMWIYAALIALSRLVVTAHHPSDVLGGAIVGVVGALLVRHYFAARGLAFAVTPQGAIVPSSGPSWRRIKAVARALLAE